MMADPRAAPPALPAQRRGRPMIPRWASLLLRLTVGLVLLGILLVRAGRGMLRAAGEIRPTYVIAAFAIALLGIVVGAWKWVLMLRRLGVRMSFGSALRLYWIGLFYNNFLPTAVGGDAMRVVVSRLELGGHTVELVASTLGERVTGVLALLVLGAGALALVPVPGMSGPLRFELAGAGLAVTLFVGWLLLDPEALRLSLKGRSIVARAVTQLQRLRSSLSECTRGTAWFTGLMALSVLRQAMQSLMILILARGIGLDVPGGYVFVVVPLACLIWMAPISVNGVGVREWAFVLLFGPMEVSQERALLLSLLTWAMIAASTSLGGPLQAVAERKPRDAAEASLTATDKAADHQVIS